MNENKLTILWTNADPLTSEHMVFMYAYNAKKMKLWEDVEVIIWGATSKLVKDDANIRNLIKESQAVGVKFRACIACANALGSTEALSGLDIELEKMGKPLTEIIKNKENLLTI